MIASLACGTSVIRNFLHSDDTLTTIEAFRALGVDIKENPNEIAITGGGINGLKEPEDALYMRGSGTSMRLLLGILAGQPFNTTLTADESLSKRPMRRVTEPLSKMGAKFEGEDNANYAPITVIGGKLRSLNYLSRIPSAQVKSAILLAGLYVLGTTTVSELTRSRDHTERMLKLFNARISIQGLMTSITGGSNLRAANVEIPGDISSAAFFIVGASIIKGSSITLRSVGINPTRTGIIDILGMMGAKINIRNIQEGVFEPRGDITVESSDLHGVNIQGNLIPRCIDELPIIMVAAACASGTTVIRGAGELKLKETDRINSMATNLRNMGAKFEVKGDEITIEGLPALRGAPAVTFSDHRTAMSMIIAGLAAQGETTIDDTECIAKSYPNFLTDLNSLLK